MKPKRLNGSELFIANGKWHLAKWFEVEQSNDLFTERELEIAYCVGMLNQKDVTIDTLSDQLSVAPEKFEMLKEWIKGLRTTSAPTKQ